MEFKPTPYTKQQFLSKLVIPKDPTYGNPNQVETELKPGQPEINRAYQTSMKDEDPSRYPKYLNEPTTSRLSRPVRGEKDGKFDGVTNESIANTTIDIQRKTRIG